MTTKSLLKLLEVSNHGSWSSYYYVEMQWWAGCFRPKGWYVSQVLGPAIPVKSKQHVIRWMNENKDNSKT